MKPGLQKNRQTAVGCVPHKGKHRSMADYFKRIKIIAERIFFFRDDISMTLAVQTLVSIKTFFNPHRHPAPLGE
jgi:hypothetical protein